MVQIPPRQIVMISKVFQGNQKFLQEDPQRDIMVPIQERVAAVKPFWEGQSAEQRVEILTVSVADLRKRAAELVEKQRKQAGTALKLLWCPEEESSGCSASAH